MKTCPNCQSQQNDEAAFCPACGQSFHEQPQPFATPVADPFDHTAEFDAKDISDNKVVSMLVYLMGAIGIIIALLVSNTSPYAAFHVRQALKICVVEILAPIALIAASVINIIPFLGTLVYLLVILAFSVLSIALFVVKIIAFLQICKGKAIEAPIVRKLNFLK